MPIPNRREIKSQLVELLSKNNEMLTKDVYSYLAKEWNLTKADSSMKRNGRALYENEIRWARQELSLEGIIEKPAISGRGIWKLRGEFNTSPEEYNETFTQPLFEGIVKRINVNAYERNKKAREACLKIHGFSCLICGFNFEITYGAIGKNFIHVHHLVELSSIGKEYIINPEKDLIPLCANCHSIIHRRKPAFTVSEINTILKSNTLTKE